VEHEDRWRGVIPWRCEELPDDPLLGNRSLLDRGIEQPSRRRFRYYLASGLREYLGW
jgi:hypothetical protein